MSISILESCKKRKRRPKLFGFQTFGDPGSPISPAGPFRENIRIFLQQCAEIEDYRIQEKMPIWCTLLVHENRSFVVPLYTIEEDVKLSTKPYCDHCRCSGWNSFFYSEFLLPWIHLIFSDCFRVEQSFCIEKKISYHNTFGWSVEQTFRWWRFRSWWSDSSSPWLDSLQWLRAFALHQWNRRRLQVSLRQRSYGSLG